MKNLKLASKIFITYFPVILLLLQLIMNNIALINNELYNSLGFYLSTFLGTNILYALFSIAYTFYFKFCSVSRAAAIAQLLFGIFYLIIKEDNIYNILYICLLVCLYF